MQCPYSVLAALLQREMQQLWGDIEPTTTGDKWKPLSLPNSLADIL